MMFKRVLINEDHESSNISIRQTLKELNITAIAYTYYCDDALTQIRKSLIDEQPFDLIITDLSFEEDHRIQQITGGADLIGVLKELDPSLKILVFSAENKATVIDFLFKQLGINGYVRKARHDAKDLKMALEELYKGKIYLSADLRQNVKQKNAYEFTEFDIIIISLLSQGKHQKDIPEYLRKNNVRPTGLSSVEKRLNLMKEELSFSKNEQLVAYCKDFGII